MPSSPFVSVTTTAGVAPGEAKSFVVGDREIALFNIDGCFYAVENACPHQGGPLAEGWIEGTTVTCPWHGWCFDVATGEMPLGEYSTVETFDVQIEGSTVNVCAEPRS